MDLSLYKRWSSHHFTFPEDHPRKVGIMGNMHYAECAAGSRVWRQTGGAPRGRHEAAGNFYTWHTPYQMHAAYRPSLQSHGLPAVPSVRSVHSVLSIYHVRQQVISIGRMLIALACSHIICQLCPSGLSMRSVLSVCHSHCSPRQQNN